jgi:hypothetical protein
MRRRKSRRLSGPKKIYDPTRNRKSLRRANVRLAELAARARLMFLCGGWFLGACGDRRLIRPSADRAKLSQARPARLTAEWFLQACDGRLQILLVSRLEIFTGKLTSHSAGNRRPRCIAKLDGSLNRRGRGCWRRAYSRWRRRLDGQW